MSQAANRTALTAAVICAATLVVLFGVYSTRDRHETTPGSSGLTDADFFPPTPDGAVAHDGPLSLLSLRHEDVPESSLTPGTSTRHDLWLGSAGHVRSHSPFPSDPRREPQIVRFGSWRNLPDSTVEIRLLWEEIEWWDAERQPPVSEVREMPDGSLSGDMPETPPPQIARPMAVPIVLKLFRAGERYRIVEGTGSDVLEFADGANWDLHEVQGWQDKGSYDVMMGRHSLRGQGLTPPLRGQGFTPRGR